MSTSTPTAHREKLTFFRQSSWMVIATLAGGFFMAAVHAVVNKPMKESEYGVFNALLRIFLLMGFPAGGLQVVFAQQAAAALSLTEQQRLSATIRAVLRGTFLVWLTLAGFVYLSRTSILELLKISNPAALWVTLVLGLASLWAPILKGLLQGRQNFAGLGWVLVVDAVGRFTAIVLIVHFGGQAAGAMTGALLGQVAMLTLGAWLLRDILAQSGGSFEWRPWLERVVPLTAGVGVVLFMCSADVVYVQTVFGKEESPFYAAAAMIGLALFTFMTPLASVMFPKVVESSVRAGKSDALRHAMLATAVLGGTVGLACTLLPELPLRILYFRKPLYWNSAPLVPWFAWSLLPLIIANVLINNLLARRRFAVVPWLVVVAAGYGLALFLLKERLVLPAVFSVEDPLSLQMLMAAYKRVIGTLGAFSTALLTVTVWFSLRDQPR